MTQPRIVELARPEIPYGMIAAGHWMPEPLGQGYWVDSVNGSSAYPGTFRRPKATIAQGIALASAGSFDNVHVKPGHSETISAADGIALDKAGVNILGIGRGTSRPKIIWDTAATADMNVTAANVLLQNFVLEAGFADVARLIQLTAAHFALVGCTVQDQTANENSVLVISATGAANSADGLKMIGNRMILPDANFENVVKFTDDCDSFVFNQNVIFVAVAKEGDGCIECATGKDLTNVEILWNYYYRPNTTLDTFIQNDTTANSGFVAHNRIGHLDTATETPIDLDGAYMFDNLATGVITASGYVVPTPDS